MNNKQKWLLVIGFVVSGTGPVLELCGIKFSTFALWIQLILLIVIWLILKKTLLEIRKLRHRPPDGLLDLPELFWVIYAQ
jgi:hypothetical protein